MPEHLFPDTRRKRTLRSQKQIQAHIDLLQEIVKDLPEFASSDAMKGVDEQVQPDHYQRTIGPALRTLHSFLNEADPGQAWGGLYKTPTPDGNILWLCDQHRQQYVARPLKLEEQSNTL
jgi:internalin A